MKKARTASALSLQPVQFHDNNNFENLANASSNPQSAPAAMKYAQKSTDIHNFDRICDLYVARRISCPAEMMAPAIEKPEVHVDFWGTYHSASSTRKHYAEILMRSKTGKSWVIFIQSKDRFKMCSRYACRNWKVNCSGKCKT